MAELIPIPLGVQTYGPRSPAVRLELSENLYPEGNPDQAKGQVTLLGTPGLKLFATVGAGPIRGMEKAAGVLFVVSGGTLYTVKSTGEATAIGTVDGAGPVNMVSNGFQVGIATTGKAYAADTTQIALLPETNLNGAAYQDGYGIFTQQGTENVWITGVDDMFTIGGLDFTNADALPDSVVTVISDHREVWVFGEETIEVFTNTGDPVFPFQRTGAGFIEHGCAAGGSVAKAENNVFWLGEDFRVYRAAGYNPQPISTPGIEYEISLEDSPQTAKSFTYSQEGHIFYVLSFAGRTLVYDLTTGRWHKRVSNGEARWRANSYRRIYQKDLVGDFKDGRIYELDLNTFTEDGEVIRRRTQSAPIYRDDRRLLLDEFILDIQRGVGLVSGQGANPKVVLDWTDNYGHTYSNEHWRTAGKIGEYRQQLKWHGLGSFRQRSYRLTISDPVQIAILQAFARVEILDR